MSNPFHTSRRDDVLHLTLNTPGSPVNIFDAAAARQVVDVLSALRPEETRAVVFSSSKPDSFLNGASLMALYAVRKAEDAARLTAGVRRAYEAVQAAKVPTIAAIRGNCFGCGLEFALHCRYRIAANTRDTRFYLHELCDYLVLPGYGAPRLLPALVGLEDAANLLLWGERWSAEVAWRRGLVHEAHADGDFEAATGSFVRQVIEGRVAGARRRPIPASSWAEAQRDRIRSLPPVYHRLYLDCLDLLLRWNAGTAPVSALRRLEAARVARSAVAGEVRPAVSYFFVRQTAHAIALRGEEDDAPSCRLAAPAPGGELRSWIMELGRTPLRGLEVSLGGSTQNATWVAEDHAPGVRQGRVAGSKPRVAIALGPVPDSARWEPPMFLYQPFHRRGGTFFELASSAGAEATSRRLYRCLSRAGFTGVLSRPSRGPVLNDWLAAWLSPMVAFCLAGGEPSVVYASLRGRGFARNALHLLGRGDTRLLARMIGPRLPRPHREAEVRAALRGMFPRPDPRARRDHRIVDALLVSLLEVALRNVADRSMPHPSCADLVAREAFAFPLHLGSLGAHMTPARVASLLAGPRRWQSLAPPGVVEAAERFASTGKGFYR